MGGVLAVHSANLGSIPCLTFLKGSPSPPEVIPGHRARSKPQASLGMAPNQKQKDQHFRRELDTGCTTSVEMTYAYNSIINNFVNHDSIKKLSLITFSSKTRQNEIIISFTLGFGGLAFILNLMQPLSLLRDI